MNGGTINNPLRGRRLVQLTLAYIALLLLAVLSGLLPGLNGDAFPITPGGEARLSGSALGESVELGEGRYRLLLNVREVDGEPWRGRVYVYYEGGPLLNGSWLAAVGQVMEFTPYGNPGAFDYGAYMRRQGIAAAVSCYYGGEVRPLRGFAGEKSSIRGRLLAAFDAAAGDNAALLKGIFLGDKSDLSFAERSALSFAGVLHACAVSGLHVGYLVAAAQLMIGPGRRRRWPRLLLTAAMLLFYIQLTGAPASILRASLMTLCLLCATALDEKNDPYTGLALAALLCLVYRPLWILDAGFQLSFAAALGLLYLRPWMMMLLNGHRPTEPRHWAGRIRLAAAQVFAVTMAASFGTMPLIGYYFYHISIVGWLISPLFVLGAGLTVILCFAAALLAVFSSTLAQVPLFAVDLLAGGLDGLSAGAATLPGAYIASGQTPLIVVLLVYTALAALPLLLKQSRRPRLRLLLILILLVLLLAFSPALSRADGRLEVVFLDVGQGDATLIVTPQGRTILIDGGGSRLAPGSVGENALLPYLRYRGIRRLDLIVSSHPDADHIDGLLTVLEHMPVGELLYADCFPESDLQQRLVRLAQEGGAALTPAYAGLRFMAEPGLTLTVLHPPQNGLYTERDNNQGSLTLLVSHGEVSFLFAGDVSFAQMAYIPAATIVKLPHHGSKNNYDEQAYRQLAAEAVVISAGRHNSYGHPAPLVVQYWQERAALFRTDLLGAVTITSDGHTWQARAYWENEYAGVL